MWIYAIGMCASETFSSIYPTIHMGLCDRFPKDWISYEARFHMGLQLSTQRHINKHNNNKN